MSAIERFIHHVVRIAVGLALLSFVVSGPRTLWGLIGIVPLLTGVLGLRPLYRGLGLTTGWAAHRAEGARP